MKRLILSISIATLALATFNGISAAEVTSQEAAKADEAFMRGLTKGAKDQVNTLLDPDFTWTDSQGKTRSKEEFLDDLWSAGPEIVNGDLKAAPYGQVVIVTASQNRVHSVRVWVERGSAWKLLADQETTLSEKANPPKSDSNDCQNPCKSLPYTPKNDDERAIIASWQELETAVTNHDAQGWAPHVSDEFLLVNNNNDHVMTKNDRMAILDKQKQTGSSSAPVPLLSAKMFDFEKAVVMKAEHQRATGKAIHVTRLWIERDGKWIMAFSQQTTVQ